MVEHIENEARFIETLEQDPSKITAEFLKPYQGHWEWKVIWCAMQAKAAPVQVYRELLKAEIRGAGALALQADKIGRAEAELVVMACWRIGESVRFADEYSLEYFMP